MNLRKVVDEIVKLGSGGRRLHVTFAVAVICMTAFIGFVAPVSAGGQGATQIAGVGYWDLTGQCADPEGAGADFAIRLEGDLVGCNYVTILRSASSPSGTYREWGTEYYVITEYAGTPVVGTFETTYLATIKFDELGGEIWGRCQHPIVAGSGEGDFDGVTGRLDYKDNVSAGVFIDAPYKGHLRWRQ